MVNNQEIRTFRNKQTNLAALYQKLQNLLKLKKKWNLKCQRLFQNVVLRHHATKIYLWRWRASKTQELQGEDQKQWLVHHKQFLENF